MHQERLVVDALERRAARGDLEYDDAEAPPVRCRRYRAGQHLRRRIARDLRQRRRIEIVRRQAGNSEPADTYAGAFAVIDENGFGPEVSMPQTDASHLAE